MTNTEPLPAKDAVARARARRSLAIALGLAVFAALVFAVTIIRLRENILARAAG